MRPLRQSHTWICLTSRRYGGLFEPVGCDAIMITLRNVHSCKGWVQESRVPTTNSDSVPFGQLRSNRLHSNDAQSEFSKGSRALVLPW